jgi:hypothetical protein
MFGLQVLQTGAVNAASEVLPGLYHRDAAKCLRKAEGNKNAVSVPPPFPEPPTRRRRLPPWQGCWQNVRFQKQRWA